MKRFSHDVHVIFGANIVLFSKDAEADRALLGKVFGFDTVDASGGWLLFALPPAEVAVHPADFSGACPYLAGDDLLVETDELARRGVSYSEVEAARWGSVTMIQLPGGGELGLYQPRHPLELKRAD